ncbi:MULTISPECIES: alkene reductase [unclassified Rhodococcus (in: high G+C Gram-positive bacteria)]|uniref:alkene reductase n=1 Tax=unclassified Rhodococcus (in: high G+C Gram-positive bacteria) TaxID=192944 RepID=UPI00233EDDC3|nr:MULTISPECIES: alkene reductase [unclassified Rhodococcus (in: high G+C Gram-positive bacteria)]WSE22401.1 alkene reductase [Rhodococcus sp. PD04]
MTRLFDTHLLGALVLDNRLVMAPMTRARCVDAIPTAETAEYYRQRATAGLIVTEGTPISPEAQGYVYVPGIWSPAQVAGWRTVTDAVHSEGGRIFAQLWHVGRLSHASLQPEGGQPVSAGAVSAPESKIFALADDGNVGFVDVGDPRPLSTDEVGRVIDDFAGAATNAEVAGFDGVELHGANGYLFEQFLNPATNTRSDRYGGSYTDRARFLLETVDAVIDVLGSVRVGIRLSPFSELFDMPAYPEAAETYLYLASELSRRNLAYIHLIDQRPAGGRLLDTDFLAAFRARFRGTIILAGGMTQEYADELFERDLIDLAAFGQPFIANPDLVARLQNGWPLTAPDPNTYYGGGAEGYLDYPRFTSATV